jgi:GDP-L-fucose synthase
LPATIRKFATAVLNGASVVEMWGTGSPRREFLHVNDLASACLHLLQNYNDELCINVGTGIDIEIRELASLVANIVGYEGEVVWDTNKPDGMPRKLLDVTRINATGWQAQIPLQQGLQEVFDWYQANVGSSK